MFDLRGFYRRRTRGLGEYKIEDFKDLSKINSWEDRSFLNLTSF